MADTPNQLGQAEIDEIKAAAIQIAPDNSGLEQLYRRYEQAYFMTDADARLKITNVDEKDVKTTISPTARNAVIGMKRLLDTAEIGVQITQRGDKVAGSEKIEKGLKHMLYQSGAFRRARVEKDLNLSAVLYGPVILAVEAVDDLIAVQRKPMYKKRLEKIRKYTPFLLRAINARQSYSRWGEYGMIAHLRKYDVTGDVIKERWGIDNLSRTTNYRVWDWLDLENRVAWIEGVQQTPLMAKKHLMSTMNISARFAGGTSLFEENEKQLQSFLYAHIKGEWDKRENLFWTYLFTALFMQGLPGPLVIVDPDSLGANARLDIDFTGGMRKIFAKAQVADYPVIDADVLKIKDLMDGINAESTIYRQTLGQNIAGSTFSGLAMLSSAGQLPLEDPKEAICQVFQDAFEHILCRIREDGSYENDLITAADIPDDYEIEVTLQPKLPQDNLRNAQVAQSLGPLVSDAWKLENILQVEDPKAMMKDILREQMLKTMSTAMMNDQNILAQMMQRVISKWVQPQAPANVNGPGPEGMPPEGMPPEGMPGPEEAAAQAAIMQQGGMEAQPQTAPQIPPQERY